MKYSMMTYTIARQQPDGKADMPAVCRLTRELGLEGIDQVHLYGYEPADLRRMADDEGLRFVCYTFSADLICSDEAARRKAVDTVLEGLDAAQVLGAPMVMIPIGRKPELSREECRRLAIATLERIFEAARGCPITISTEHFVCAAPFITSQDMNALTSALPEMRVTFDAGCVLTGGEEPSAAFLNNREKVVHAHFKDYVEARAGESGMPGLDGRTYRGALIGEGLVDYRKLVATMRRSGYGGYVNIEYEGDKYPADAAIRKALEYLRNLEQELAQEV
ncbi:MAG: sugar phosphate isomerase/epimerase [Phycisphaerae bacterium]|nr:sugar phosphate isomerase/epimerase [Phycisphaerae bacterium]